MGNEVSRGKYSKMSGNLMTNDGPLENTLSIENNDEQNQNMNNQVKNMNNQDKKGINKKEKSDTKNTEAQDFSKDYTGKPLEADRNALSFIKLKNELCSKPGKYQNLPTNDDVETSPSNNDMETVSANDEDIENLPSSDEIKPISNNQTKNDSKNISSNKIEQMLPIGHEKENELVFGSIKSNSPERRKNEMYNKLNSSRYGILPTIETNDCIIVK